MGNLIIAFLDQLFVSGGNFITLALGANFLSLDDQGKLCYVMSLYAIATLINVALIFSVAPVIKKSLHSISHVFYRQQLLLVQLSAALSISLVLCYAIYLFGDFIHWDVDSSQLAFVFIFLVIQQMLDFFRRSAYIFEGVKQALFTSISLYMVRIIIILLIRPSNLSEMLLLLILSCFSGILPIIFLYKRKFFKIYRQGFHKTSLIYHFHLAKWNISSAPLGWISFFLPAFILGWVETTSSVAIYLSIRSLSGAVNILLELLETFIPKWLADFDRKKNLLEATIKLLTIGIAIWISVLIFISIYGRNLILVLFGNKYSEFLLILILFWVGNGLHFITRVFGLYCRANKNTFFEFFGAVGGCLGLFVSLPFIINKGMYGAALSTIIVPAGILFAQVLLYSFKPNIKN